MGWSWLQGLGGRLTRPSQEGLHKGYKQRINAGFGLLAVTWVGVVLTLVLSCRPIHKYWQIHPDPGSKYNCPFIPEPSRS